MEDCCTNLRPAKRRETDLALRPSEHLFAVEIAAHKRLCILSAHGQSKEQKSVKTHL